MRGRASALDYAPVGFERDIFVDLASSRGILLHISCVMVAADEHFDVFISHSTQDANAASAIKHHLQSSGLRCWKAPDDIYPGESWPSAISRALATCRIMVLVWSRNSLASKEVAKELTIAMRNGLSVIPFRIEDVRATGEWDYHLANTHWMDAFPGKLDAFVAELATRIHGLLNSKSALPVGMQFAPQSPPRVPWSGKFTWITACAAIAVAAISFWLAGIRAGKHQPAAIASGAADKTADELAAWREKAQQAERDKAEALRLAAEREAANLRQSAQRAEEDKQEAMRRAAQAEQMARDAQSERLARSSTGPSGMAPQEGPVQSASGLGPRSFRGTISDPDGFTNIRRGPGLEDGDGSEIPIVGRIATGEVFDYYPDNSSWWMVRKADGTQGFVHSSRVVAADAVGARGPWLFADSSARILQESELRRLNREQLWRARSEILARCGYAFPSSRGQALTRQLGSAYAAVSGDLDLIMANMNAVERENISRIERLERALQP